MRTKLLCTKSTEVLNKRICHSEHSEESKPVKRCFLRQHDKNCVETESGWFQLTNETNEANTAKLDSTIIFLVVS